MDRSASAVWKGSLKEGSGTISTQSGTLKDTQYSFKARFADGVGTNPEELIAAAHAGCFTMALSAEITKAGLTPDSIETTAALTLDLTGEKPTITKIHLTTKAKLPRHRQGEVRRTRPQRRGRLPRLPRPQSRRDHPRRHPALTQHRLNGHGRDGHAHGDVHAPRRPPAPAARCTHGWSHNPLFQTGSSYA